jgi:hypothetical protein
MYDARAAGGSRGAATNYLAPGLFFWSGEPGVEAKERRTWLRELQAAAAWSPRRCHAAARLQRGADMNAQGRFLWHSAKSRQRRGGS